MCSFEDTVQSVSRGLFQLLSERQKGLREEVSIGERKGLDPPSFSIPKTRPFSLIDKAIQEYYNYQLFREDESTYRVCFNVWSTLPPSDVDAAPGGLANKRWSVLQVRLRPN